jgi:PAS domain S-box-containing protein
MDENTPKRNRNLRQQAEARIDATFGEISSMTIDEIKSVMYELQVHQVELEMQNDELHASEQALAEAHNRYRDLYEFAPVGYLTLDSDRRIENANLTVASMLQMNRRDIIGKRFSALVLSEDRDVCHVHLQQALHGGEASSVEIRPVQGREGLTCLQMTATAIWGRTGEFEGWRVTLQDISARYEAREAVRRSEQEQRHQRELLERIFDMIPVLLVLWDPRLKRFTLNRHCEEVLGWSTEQANAGDFIGMVYPDPEYREQVESYMCSLQPGWKEIRCTTDKGEEIPIDWANVRLTDDTRIGIGVDLRERKEAQAALERMNASLEQRVNERTMQLRLISDAARTANETEDLEHALNFVIRRLSEFNGWLFGHAYLPDPEDADTLVAVKSCYQEVPGRFDSFRRLTAGMRLKRGQGLPGRVYDTGEPEWTLDLQADLLERRADLSLDLGLKCATAFPIWAGAENVGVLEFFGDHVIEPKTQVLDTMTAVGTQLGRVIERSRVHRQVSAAVLAEQERIASVLHDTVSQQLVGTALSLDRIARQLDSEGHQKAQAVHELIEGIREAQQLVRQTSHELVPVSGHKGALNVALQELADSACENGVSCEFECDDPLDLPDPANATHLYYIVSEALKNAVKHANADCIVISARQDSDNLVVEVRDDGSGFDVAAPHRGAGLRIMRHRAALLGAQLEITSDSSSGTSVRCTIGMEPQHVRL